MVADSVDAHFQKSSLMDYLLDQRFDADMGASTIDGESGSFYIQTRDHDSPLIDGTAQEAHALLNSVIWNDGKSDPQARVFHSGASSAMKSEW